MINTIFKPKGSRIWRWKFRLCPADKKIEDVSLGTPDKQGAEAKRAALLREKVQERAGFIPPKCIRDSVQKPLVEHLREFVADLQAQRRNGRYIRTVQNAVLKLAADCDWKSVQNVTADSFQTWRAGQTKAAKTLNEYLGACVALLNWMMRNGRVSANPLVTVRKVETRGKETLIRRAYTADEIERLLAVSGPQHPVYSMALLTGVRHNELKGLRWGDLDLISDTPSVAVRSSISKNHKTAFLPLHPDLAVELSALKPAGATNGDLVFKGLVPRSKRFKAHLKAAGIPKKDAQGHIADFHSLRHTFCTSLHCAGASQREAQELMRHSDPRLTASTYTDTKLLGLRAAVGKLSLKASQIASQNLVASGHSVSQPVTTGSLPHGSETVESKGDKSLPVILGHNLSRPEEWCALQGLNLRPLPCEGNALPLS
jgi:integrase